MMQDPVKAPPPKKQDPLDKIAARRAARRQPQQPPPPGEKPMSVGGFAENTLRNIWDIAKGLVNVFPTALKSGAEVFGDPDGMRLLAENPEHLVSAFRNTASNLKDAIIEPYQKHGMRVLYEEPVTPLLDALTIISLGGGSIAKAGRLAGNAKLAETGTKIAGIPERIAAQLVKAPLRAVGINPETRQMFLRSRRLQKSGAKIEAGVRKNDILGNTKNFTPEELIAAERIVLDGGKLADLAANPRVAELYTKLDNWLKKERELELGEQGRHFLTDEQMANRVIREYAERNGLDFKTAAQKYNALEVKPLYAPVVREGAGDVVNAFSQTVIKKGKVGFLERFESALGSTKDIRVRIARGIDDFYNHRANMRLMDTIIQTPGLAKVAGRGEVPLKEILPSQGIHSKYYGDKSRAQSLYISGLEAQHGKAKAAQLLKSDVATQKALSQAVNIAIPDDTLRNLIRREFTSYGGDMGAVVRIYDRITNLFRVAATKLSPRWYTGNILGDALLASLAGSNWGLAKRLIQDHVKHGRVKVLGAGGFGQAAETGNKLNTLSDFVGAVDDSARAGVFSKAVADKLRSTATRFAASEETLRAAAVEVALAPEELADLMVRNQQLGEHAARSSLAIRKMDKEIASLTKKRLKSKPEQVAGIEANIHYLQETREAAVADLTRNMMQREIERIPELARKAEIAEQAMDRANTFLGEYLGLGPIERGVFRRAVPFFPWTKAMAKLAFTFPFIAPKKAFFWHRYAAAMTEMMGDPELPDWMAAYAPVFMRQNGDTVWGRITSISPFGSLRTEKIGGVPVPSIVAFWQANPWLSVGYRLVGGKDVFSPSSLPYGEHLVAINDGEVMMFNQETGMIERKIAQPPLIRTLMHLFPVVQLGEQLISNYDVRKGKPVLNSDGTVKYPISLLYRLSDAIGMKLMDRNREDVIRGEKIRVRKALMELKQQYKRAGPEDREFIKGVFQDYARGEYRRIESR